MPFELAQAAIEKYSPQELIPSTMGEPLLYSRFKELLEFCRVRNIKINLTTNGTFPHPWNSKQGMDNLLTACSDIKISTLAYEVGGISQRDWLENVERLLEYHRIPFDSLDSCAFCPMENCIDFVDVFAVYRYL